MNHRVGIGLAGCGRIATLLHLPILHNHPGARLVAVAEPDDERRAEALAAAPGTRGTTDYRSMFEDPEIEAVVITLPTPLHAEAGTAALQAGKSVYLEKPIATSLIEAAPLIQASLAGRDGKVPLAAVGFNFRFHPAYQSFKVSLERGRLGQPTLVRTLFCSASRSFPDWKRRRDSGGGVLLDLASHHFDLIRFLFGRPVTSVRAHCWSRRMEQDEASVVLELDDGPTVQCWFAAGTVEDHRFEIQGSRGRLAYDRIDGPEPTWTATDHRWARLRRVGRGLRWLSPLSVLRSTGADLSFAGSLSRFIDAVRRGQPDPEAASMADGLEALRLVEMCEASARSGGKPISCSASDQVVVSSGPSGVEG